MRSRARALQVVAIASAIGCGVAMVGERTPAPAHAGPAAASADVHHDRSGGLAPPAGDADQDSMQQGSRPAAPIVPPVITTPEGSGAVEQRAQGAKPGPLLVESFDGLGNGFSGPQGEFRGGNPSDNSVAVGPDNIVQIVNSRTAIYTKKGKKFATTGKVLYGPVPTNNFFKGFGGTCEAMSSGDGVARYDQLGGYDPRYRVDQGAYILGSYLFPKLTGQGRFQALGKYAYAEFREGLTRFNPDYNQKTTELDLNYILKQFDARVMIFFKDTRFNAVNPNNKQFGVGLQLQI